MFVNGHLETVSDGQGNTIWVKAKMDIRTAAQVSADMVKFYGANSLIAHETCLLRRNIVRWAGPDFTDEKGKIIPCTPENVDKLDPNEPLVADVVAKIRELNRRKEEPAPAEEAADGEAAGEGEAADPTTAASVT